MAHIVIPVLIRAAKMATTLPRVRRRWIAAAEACGLSLPAYRPWGLTFYASLEDLHVTFLRPLRGEEGATRLRVTGLAPVTIRSEVRRGVLAGVVRAPVVATGDDSFDAAFAVSGAEGVVRALLDAETRSALRRLGTFTLERGKLERDVPRKEEERLAERLGQVLDVARRLRPPDPLLPRLVRVVREDYRPGVRMAVLRFLVATRSGPEVREALRPLLKDDDEQVRLQAAMQMGEEGQGAVRELLRAADERCAARAIAHLGGALAEPEILGLLQADVTDRRLHAAQASVEALGGRVGESACRALAGVLSAAPPALAAAVARTLATATPPAPAAERVLAERGLVHTDEGARLAAAVGLGRIGSAAAVLPLQEAAARHGGALRRAAGQAVAAIQSRLSGAAPGQLTVAAEGGGALSLAPAGGEVSLPE